MKAGSVAGATGQPARQIRLRNTEFSQKQTGFDIIDFCHHHRQQESRTELILVAVLQGDATDFNSLSLDGTLVRTRVDDVTVWGGGTLDLFSNL
jgi:hypothetical protein